MVVAEGRDVVGVTVARVVEGAAVEVGATLVVVVAPVVVVVEAGSSFPAATAAQIAITRAAMTPRLSPTLAGVNARFPRP